MKILDSKIDFHDGDHEGRLVIQRTQDIPQWFLDENAAERAESTSAPMGEIHRFARIPEAVWDTWMRQGFDPRRVSPAAVIARMKQEGLDYFLTTDRKL